MVETFTLCSWSPPVPTMSMASGPMEKVTALSIMASMNPIISSAVSPFAVSAVRKLAISTGSTEPDRISRQGVAGVAPLEIGAAHERIENIECEGVHCLVRRKRRRRHSDTILVAAPVLVTTTISEMAPTYLDTILESHRRRAASDERDWRSRVDDIRYDGPSFILVLRQGSSPFIKVIAEVKRRSPSKGLLAPDLDVAALAAIYRDEGASAISVLTDRDFFQGSMDDLLAVRRTVALPVLRKDFTVSENDVLDAVEAGASAVLLIVAALSDEELASFISLSDQCGIDALVEIHDDEEARRAVDAGARIIGINQRNLHTFDVDPERAASLISELPRECLTVCESGLSSVADVERAASAGFDGVLVGEAFITASDPGAAVKSFALVPSSQRA